MCSSDLVNITDCGLKTAEKEIEVWTINDINEDNINDLQTNAVFLKRKILVRAITDYIAGMTDDYALQEYEKML